MNVVARAKETGRWLVVWAGSTTVADTDSDGEVRAISPSHFTGSRPLIRAAGTDANFAEEQGGCCRVAPASPAANWGEA